MAKLTPNWITEGHIDFEYKKYLLLGYLKTVRDHFNEKKLYPILSDLLFHHNNLISLKEKKEFAASQFPARISRLDFEKFTMEYEKMVEDDEYIEEIGQIITYALPLIKKHLSEGAELYEDVEDKIEIQPLGIQPLSNEKGYLFVNEFKSGSTQVHSYQITIFENVEARYRGIRTDFIGSYVRSISNTLENIKIRLIRETKAINSLAAYVVNCRSPFPFEETLLPVAKRSLVRYLAKDSQDRLSALK